MSLWLVIDLWKCNYDLLHTQTVRNNSLCNNDSYCKASGENIHVVAETHFSNKLGVRHGVHNVSIDGVQFSHAM